MICGVTMRFCYSFIVMALHHDLLICQFSRRTPVNPDQRYGHPDGAGWSVGCQMCTKSLSIPAISCLGRLLDARQRVVVEVSILSHGGPTNQHTRGY